MQWVWDHSQSQNAARLVLLAIADNAADDGGHAYPSNATLQRKANLSERGVRTAVASLVKIGELTVRLNQGRAGTNMYQIVMTPAESAPPTPTPEPVNPADSAPTPRQDLPHPPAGSAPRTVLEPPVEPSLSSFDAEASPNAGLIVKGFIDWLSGQDDPVKLTSSVVARLGKEIKSCLKDGIDEGTVKRALVEMARRGKAGWPSMLQSFVVEVQNRPVSAPPAGHPPLPPRPQFKSSAEQNIDRQKVRQARARVLDAIMEAGLSLDEAKDQVKDWSDGDFLKRVAPSTVPGYIDGDVIDSTQRPEVES